ncbi:hypothetical protein BJ684DRAFT_1119, partial [Piptocephalis cylindrospora]
RPMNSFILYRRNTRGMVPRDGVNTASRYLGNRWQMETQKIKEHYKSLARAYQNIHQFNYPSYKYEPQ